MTEEMWLKSTDPNRMLQFARGKISNRKVRLLACAVCRLRWGEFHLPFFRTAIECAEAFSDGIVGSTQLQNAELDASEAIRSRSLSSSTEFLIGMAAKMTAAKKVSINGIMDRMSPVPPMSSDLRVVMTCIVRDIFGNPFRPVEIDPRWLTSNVVDLSRFIYDERAFDRMPILADALMDAGCDSEEMLNHCRGDGPHVRGCWVVDLLTGRE